MIRENKIEETELTQTADFLPSDGASCSPSSVAEMAALEKAIFEGDAAIWHAQKALDNIHRKQSARRQELGYQKARMEMKLSRVSHTPVEGAEMIMVQTDAGIATRWIRPANVLAHPRRDGSSNSNKTLIAVGWSVLFA